MNDIEQCRARFDAFLKQGLSLDLTRGQPSNEQFELSGALLESLNRNEYCDSTGLDCRNYPGSMDGLQEARDLFAPVLEVDPDLMIVANTSSLDLMSRVLSLYYICGTSERARPWIDDRPIRFLACCPGYDRHFSLSESLGIEIVPVPFPRDLETVRAIEKIAKGDRSVKGMWLVPKYSNPGGETLSDEVVEALASFETAAQDFRLFADNAYAVHDLYDVGDNLAPMMQIFEQQGNADRLVMFGSTAKITLPAGAISFMAVSEKNKRYLLSLFSKQTISWNKLEQLRHVRFLQNYPGGIRGLMQQHAKSLRPKFEMVDSILSRELDSSYASWSKPKGGYFVSVDTRPGLAKRVVQLALELGVKLTPAGATFPLGRDPNDSNIRLAPTRPDLKDVEIATEVLALCIKIATLESDS